MPDASLPGDRDTELAAIREQAVRWVLRLAEPEAGADDRAACAEWRAAHPSHDAVYRQIVRLWGAFESAAESPRNLDKRLKCAAVLLLGCVIALALGMLQPFPRA